MVSQRWFCLVISPGTIPPVRSSRASTQPSEGLGAWEREVVRETDSCPHARRPSQRGLRIGRDEANGPFILLRRVCLSLCSGTLTSMGTATSHRKSSRSFVGTSLTSAPLGTSTRTSEEGWELGEREGKLTSPLGFSFLLGGQATTG